MMRECNSHSMIADPSSIISISSSLLSLAFPLHFCLVPLVAFVSFLAFLVIFRASVLLSEDSSASSTEAFRHADERAFQVLLPGMMRLASSVFFFFWHSTQQKDEGA